MPKTTARKFISLRGVRHNNLKNFDLDLPIGKLVVITGLSGSGKSSLAFDTLFAEGQRRYIETFSPYARQFFDRMDKPQVDSIEGIPPAIAIEQRNTVKTTRSTVGTMTEICDYAKVIWAHMAELYCRRCGQLVWKETPERIWAALMDGAKDRRGVEILVTFELPLSTKISLDESLGLVAKQGYQRLLIGDQVHRIDESLESLRMIAPASLTIVQDRARLEPGARHRVIEALEQAYHFGKGKLTIHFLPESSGGGTAGAGEKQLFSNRFHCAQCDIEYREPSAALFSFNHPVGACPTCRGFGRTIALDYGLVMPDRSKTLAEGVVRPWLSGQGAESQEDLMKFCRLRRVPTDVPFAKLPGNFQDWVINGDPGYGENGVEWPRAWYGVKGYFKWLESKAYKMHVRVLLSRYRAYVPCQDCHGSRFKPEVLQYKLAGSAKHENRFTISDFYQLSLHDALRFVDSLLARRSGRKVSDPLTIALTEVQQRLRYLNEVGLGYLTLDRPTRSLSGGETERVNLTTCLGSGLVNTLFVLDEPSVGLHPRDTDRLISIMQRLRDRGNTVVVVEHEPSVMRAADEIVDIGPGHGEAGGQVVFQGSYEKILKTRGSLTGRYLAGDVQIAIPRRRLVDPITPLLEVTGANVHNLKNLSITIPLSRFVCITGVSGSGKTTLVREVLVPLLQARLKAAPSMDGEGEGESPDETGQSGGSNENDADIRGCENIGRVLLVDQSPIGRTPRSNPAVYIGAFEDIREVFAQSDMARQRGLKGSAFSFNSAEGQCEKCRGAGFEKIEMQFLSDIFITCPACEGRRYREHILEITILPPCGAAGVSPMSIADLLDATVDDAVAFLARFTKSRHAGHAVHKLKLLQEVGLGYLRLGQPINTLSGGESQRLKLVSHLADFGFKKQEEKQKPAFFLFDEPTTGLHFEDVRVLLAVFQKLVDAGHSVLVIEHNLEMIKCADWLIDLGPDAGDAGGNVVATGTPEEVMRCGASHTGRALNAIHLGQPGPGSKI